MNPLAATSVAGLSSLIDYTTCFDTAMGIFHGYYREGTFDRVACFRPFCSQSRQRREYFKPIAKNGNGIMQASQAINVERLGISEIFSV